jgi:hypothetical protein
VLEVSGDGSTEKFRDGTDYDFDQTSVRSEEMPQGEITPAESIDEHEHEHELEEVPLAVTEMETDEIIVDSVPSIEEVDETYVDSEYIISDIQDVVDRPSIVFTAESVHTIDDQVLRLNVEVESVTSADHPTHESAPQAISHHPKKCSACSLFKSNLVHIFSRPMNNLREIITHPILTFRQSLRCIGRSFSRLSDNIAEKLADVILVLVRFLLKQR